MNMNMNIEQLQAAVMRLTTEAAEAGEFIDDLLVVPLDDVFTELEKIGLDAIEYHRDALRYRWLRDKAIHTGFDDGTMSPWCVFGTGHEDAAPIAGDKLDDAIDKAAAEGRIEHEQIPSSDGRCKDRGDMR